MMSFAMHAGGPLSRKGVPIEGCSGCEGNGAMGARAGGLLTGRHDREAGFVCIEKLISPGYRCPDGGEAEA